MNSHSTSGGNSFERKTLVWIDLDNTPHVPFFRPIIRELESQSVPVLVTARDAFQVCELADVLGVKCIKIGRHYGKNSFRKIIGLIWRSIQLIPIVIRHRPSIAVSHGSRSQILLSNVCRIPSVMLIDYEHARMPFLLSPRWEIVPEAIRLEKLHCKCQDRVLTYSGIKEDVYATDFRLDEDISIISEIDGDRVIITCRPPANEAHYHASESDELFNAFIEFASCNADVQIILLPRNKKQEAFYRKLWSQWFDSGSIIIPSVAVDGLSLVWYSDLVVSGGGTMNREAAALGVPVYSVFKGPLGSVDRELERQGRLVLIESVAEVTSKIPLKKRQRKRHADIARVDSPLATIVEHIKAIKKHEELND